MDLNEGPDKLIETSSYISTKLTDAVKLRSGAVEHGLTQVKPISIYSIFQNTVEKAPDKIALGIKQSINLK